MARSIGYMQPRIKSSFIYLANAVSDLRGNWATLTLVLSPLVLISALFLLPAALHLQHALVHTFEPGVRSVGWFPAQAPYTPEIEPGRPVVVHWVIRVPVPGIVLILIAPLVILVTLCLIKRIESGARKARILNEAIEIYRDAIALVPAFFWILIMQLIVVAAGFVLLLIPGLFAIVWLAFAQYALVFDDRHSLSALFYSRDLIRGRFVKVAVRIVVFLAFWSGFTSWVGAAFFISLLVQLIGIWTGALWQSIFLFNLIGFAVAYVTFAFFIAAGARLYRDLKTIAAENVVTTHDASPPATAPLMNSGLPATE